MAPKSQKDAKRPLLGNQELSVVCGRASSRYFRIVTQSVHVIKMPKCLVCTGAMLSKEGEEQTAPEIMMVSVLFVFFLFFAPHSVDHSGSPLLMAHTGQV
jgi:hypothetical protein